MGSLPRKTNIKESSKVEVIVEKSSNITQMDIKVVGKEGMIIPVIFLKYVEDKVEKPIKD